ncbi:MAG: hypothetical protein IJ222_09755 [Bacteroidales bacterium]|nr:hypothetical protein [Bacteroidales bacterium]
MKKLFVASLAITMVFAGTKVSAQESKWGPDEANCKKYISFYETSYDNKDYENATTNWRKVYDICPHGARQTVLTKGATLLKKLIEKNKNNPEYRAALIDSVLTLHEERAKYFPSSSVNALNAKGIDIVNLLRGNNKAIYEGLNGVIERNQGNTNPNLFVNNLNSAIELFKIGEVSAEDVINVYQRNIDLVEKAPSATAADTGKKQQAKSDLEALFISSKVASCEELINLFTPRYEANPDDLALVTNIVKMLSVAEDCQGNDLFLNAVTSMYKLDPSYNSAYYLFRLNASRGNIDTAIKYIDEAIAYDESDASTDASYNYEAATLCYKNGRLAKAYAYANSALGLDASMAGKAYFLMGQIWGTTSCGGDEVERRAHYWVAVDFLNKAKNADASLADEANKHIGSYSVYFPQTAEAFMYNITDGQSYRVVCNGMQATTTVRTRK